mmetsp:Transcript_10665/g.11726  ORF Transcript_10665/g.11726 Transcript_10665/m.11726 type:complete len:275 (-) Transcript_10665:162-986(-)
MSSSSMFNQFICSFKFVVLSPSSTFMLVSEGYINGAADALNLYSSIVCGIGIVFVIISLSLLMAVGCLIIKLLIRLFFLPRSKSSQLATDAFGSGRVIEATLLGLGLRHRMRFLLRTGVTLKVRRANNLFISSIDNSDCSSSSITFGVFSRYSCSKAATTWVVLKSSRISTGGSVNTTCFLSFFFDFLSGVPLRLLYLFLSLPRPNLLALPFVSGKRCIPAIEPDLICLLRGVSESSPFFVGISGMDLILNIDKVSSSVSLSELSSRGPVCKPA